MTKYHRTTAALNLARELAKKVIDCKENGADNHTIDDMAAMAEYILIEVEEREKE